MGLEDANPHFEDTRTEIRKKCREFLKENIGSYGHAFLTKLNNQPNFSFPAYRDLLSDGDGQEDGEESEILSESLILETADIKKTCSVS